MRFIDNLFRNALASHQNYTYCFQIIMKEYEDIFLTSSDKEIKSNNMIFQPHSGLSIKEAIFNDSAQNHIIIEGIFEERGINNKMDLTESQVKIFIYVGAYLYPFVTYNCSIFVKYDLKFKIRLESESAKFQQSIVNFYSKSCRANFGDEKCKIKKDSYKIQYKIKEIMGNNLNVLNMDKEDGHYIGGNAYLSEDNRLCYKILNHKGANIEIESILAEHIKLIRKVYLTPGCDKSFITCCNKFNNEVNFRGEPHIPGQDFLKM